MEERKPSFEVIVSGIIFDPEKKKILIGKRKPDPYIEKLEWAFPGGRLEEGEEIDQALKKKIKLKTGYEVKNIGTFFSRTYEEKDNLVSIMFLTRVFSGEEMPGDDIVELKWVSPKEIDKYFKYPKMHTKLREFLLELV